MHSWHCSLAAITAPSLLGEEKLELAMPATCPVVSMSRSSDLGGARRLPPPEPREGKNNSRNFSRRAPTASNFSKPNPIGSIKLWQVKQLGLVTCSERRSRLVCGLASVIGGRFVLTP